MFKALVVIKRDLLREKIAGLLSREKEIWSAMQVSDENGLHMAMLENRPELVVYDMDDESFGENPLKEIKKSGGSIFVIAFSDEDAEGYRQEAIKAGADEYAGPDSLNQVIRRVIDRLKSIHGEAKSASA